MLVYISINACQLCEMSSMWDGKRELKDLISSTKSFQTAFFLKKRSFSFVSGTRDIVSIDPKENRLLYLANEADLEHDTITFRKSLLKRYRDVLFS